MPFALVVEDGSAKPDANSYASVADADAYNSGRLYSAAWADGAAKEQALATATMLIDAHFNFTGARSTVAQALAWPRLGVLNPERDLSMARDAASSTFIGEAALSRPIYYGGSEYLAVNIVPKQVVQACCELARLLLEKNREIDPSTAGIRSFSIGGGALRFDFDASDRPGIFTPTVLAMLKPFGRQRISKGGNFVPIVRV